MITTYASLEDERQAHEKHKNAEAIKRINQKNLRDKEEVAKACQLTKDLAELQPQTKLGLIKEAMAGLPPEMLEDIRREAFSRAILAYQNANPFVAHGTYQMGDLPLPDPENHL